MRNLVESQEYNSDDPTTLDPVVRAAMHAYIPKHFGPAIAAAAGAHDTCNEGDAKNDPTLSFNSTFEVESEWIGILAFTPDRCPLVGPLPKHTRPNEFILAGYTGHGMPIAFLAGRNIADMIRGEDLPSPYVYEAFHPSRFSK